ncbi:hypothetical protein OF829_13255 [Sphingomonas sp. LB-2]|uniref:hypothetical protein n=1 Tax=Sphingomonas caeni TaxID=2984949 RepID=UPI0022325722|nr:hypothetical protein [Sphingomonas caeni]MCW3848207.1 hypothetical protein [Sphingomonas caeni]
MNDRAIAETFEISRVLSRSFDTIGKNPGLFFGLSLVLAGAPSFLMSWWSAQLGVGRDPNAIFAMFQSSEFWLPMVGIWFVYVLTDAVLQGALTRATVQSLTGETPGFAECLEIGLIRLLPIVVIDLLVTIGTSLGMMLLIVPGVILALCWAVAVPAYVEERIGIAESFNRSLELTRGERGNIFLVMLVVVVILWIIGMITSAINMAGGGNPLVAAVAGGLDGTISRMVWVAVIAVIYVDLRAAKEGPRTNELETVFS